jgi:Ca2+-binding RTX toxin-like protein
MAFIRDPLARRLSGTNDDDLVEVNAPNLFVSAGAGNDYIYVVPGAPRGNFNVVSGDSGVDVVDFSLLTTGLTIRMPTSFGSGSAFSQQSGTVILQSIEAVVGSQGADNITGADGTQLINGAGGADVIEGGRGNDFLTGGADGDRFVFNLRSGRDEIDDFDTSGADKDALVFQRLVFPTAQAALSAAAQVGNDVVITLSPADSVTLKNESLGSLTADHIIIA